MPSYYATCPAGAEQLLAAELRSLGIEDPKPTRGGVGFDSEDIEQAYRVCLHSHAHQRLLLILARFKATTPDELYAGAQQLDWSEHLDVDGTFRIDAKLRDTELGKPHFAALRVKDAIADQFREKHERRPSVQIRNPDLRIDLFVHKQSAQLAMDLGGSWKEETPRGAVGDAMDASVLMAYAAVGQQDIAIVSAAHVDAVVQAAMHAAGMAPGLFKHEFGFATWLGHVPAKWNRLLKQAQEQAEQQSEQDSRRVHVFESDPKTLSRARQFARVLGVDRWIYWHSEGAWEMRPPAEQGVLLVCLSSFAGDQSGPVETAVTRRFNAWRVVRRVEMGEGQTRPWKLKQTGYLKIMRGKREVQLQEYRPAASKPQSNIAPEPAHAPAPAVSPWARQESVPATATEPTAAKSPWARQESVPPSAPTPAPSVSPWKQRQAASDEESLPESVAEPLAAPPIATDLLNRLRKNLKHLGRWARKQNVSCYRLYDADLPNFAAAVDIYHSDQLWAVIQEYAPPDDLPTQVAEQRLQQIVLAVQEVLELPAAQVELKQRQRQRGLQQYEKLNQRGKYHTVQEAGLKLMVNFSDYLDTGLFLDHRDVRAELGALAEGKHVLNLFAYTGVATLHMVAGGARSSTTVDMSRTYLDWAQRNLLVNKLQGTQHRFIQADCLQWMEEQAKERSGKRYGLIFLDPPTFSSSKRMQDTFDVQRDHVALIRQAMSLLRPGGELVFSNNYRKFKLDRDALADLSVDDITIATLPEDFKRRPRIHSVFLIRNTA
ncbi:MAG: bifunctional 23S rRNA (guanine(2069)-N(7))-methyltransferase RlmK/23S rRNA (guanine(2445)-N(2))-methyltransferase RlmL [Oceanococcus sp.]